jgi:gamma-glutamylcyclotransferase (GGCT)/AIG2-like uncharacterized protein YtfP
MVKLYYFAYDTDMCEEHLEKQIGKVYTMDTFKLKHYELDFNCGNSGIYTVANIIFNADEESYVEGVLYRLSDQQIYALDRIKEYPAWFSKGYFELPEKDSIAWTYISYDNLFNVKANPSLFYIKHMLDGAKHNGLVETYKSIKEYVMNNVALKKRNKQQTV